MNRNLLILIGVVILATVIVAVIGMKNKKKKPTPSPSPPPPPPTPQPAPPAPPQIAPVPEPQRLKAPLQHPMDARFFRDDVIGQRASSREQAEIYNAVKQKMLQQGMVMNTPQPFDAASSFDISMASVDPNNTDVIGGGLATSAILIPGQGGTQLIEIDATTFQRIQTGELDAIVFFYMDGCQLCREVRPKLSSVAAGISQKSFVSISDAKSSPFWSQYKIERFPTLLKFKAGVPVAYQGDWNVPSLTAFAGELSPI